MRSETRVIIGALSALPSVAGAKVNLTRSCSCAEVMPILAARPAESSPRNQAKRAEVTIRPSKGERWGGGGHARACGRPRWTHLASETACIILLHNNLYKHIS